MPAFSGDVFLTVRFWGNAYSVRNFNCEEARWVDQLLQDRWNAGESPDVQSEARYAARNCRNDATESGPHHSRAHAAGHSERAGCERFAYFNELKKLLQTSDGNLSVHARRLEEAEYVACNKSFAGRMPKSEYRLTAAGRKAFERYLNHMEALIQAAREK